MRILLLNQYYRPDLAATGQLLADLAEEFMHRGHEVHVLCSCRTYDGGGACHPHSEVVGGVNIHRVSATGFGRKCHAGRLIDYVSFYLLATWRALWMPKPDVCIALSTPPFIGLVGVLLKLIRGSRLALWTMDLYPEVFAAYGMMPPRSVVYRVLSAVSRWLYSHASAIFSLGEVMTARLVAAGADPARITTVHNWVPGESVRPKPRESSSMRRTLELEDQVTLLYSGNLGLGHELDTAVRAAGMVDGGSALRVLFVGNGTMREPLQQLAADLSISSISFHPPQPLENLADSLAAGDIHLVAQRPGTEGVIVPSKLYDSLAAGRPALFIGPEGCEAARIFRESQSGMVVPPGDVDGAAEVLRMLVQNAELRATMGRNARAYYEGKFGRERSVNIIISLIEKPLSSPSPHMEKRPLSSPSPHMEKAPLSPPSPHMEKAPLFPPSPHMEKAPLFPPSPHMEKAPLSSPSPYMERGQGVRAPAAKGETE